MEKTKEEKLREKNMNQRFLRRDDGYLITWSNAASKRNEFRECDRRGKLIQPKDPKVIRDNESLRIAEVFDVGPEHTNEEIAKHGWQKYRHKFKVNTNKKAMLNWIKLQKEATEISDVSDEDAVPEDE